MFWEKHLTVVETFKGTNFSDVFQEYEKQVFKMYDDTEKLTLLSYLQKRGVIVISSMHCKPYDAIFTISLLEPALMHLNIIRPRKCNVFTLGIDLTYP